MSDSRPIGVLDSGIGGITVVREIHRLMPNEQVVYFGDTAHAPYGNRSDEAIRSLTLQSCTSLLQHDIKLLVVACNTMTSVALEAIEHSVHDIPVIGGILPGARAAVLRTADRKIGVIGTQATIRSGSYGNAIHAIDDGIQVFATATPLLIPLCEEMMLDHDITRMVTQFYLYEMVDSGVDCLILGCTYYPCLMEVIQGTVGTRTQLLDCSLWTAKEVQDILMALDLRSDADGNGAGKSVFTFSEDPEYCTRLIPVLYGNEIPVVARQAV